MNIPYENMEIEQIYTQLLSQPKNAIAICSAEQGEGVTSLACALAQRSLLAGHSTLIVDLNLYRPTIKNLLSLDDDELASQDSNAFSSSSLNLQETSINTLLNTPQLVGCDNNSAVLHGITAPNKRENIIKLRQPGILEQCIEEWLKQYDTVIIDTSPLNRVNAQNIPAERIAAACNGAILCVLAGHTPEAAINSAMAKLNSTQAQLLGCVFNDRDNPTLKQELLREVKRIEPIVKWLAHPLRKMINKSRLLALEV